MYTKCCDRINRVSHEIKKKLSIIVQQKVHDPRINNVIISEVQVSKDFKNAKIFITLINQEKSEEIQLVIMTLQRASKLIRFLLANSMRLRVVPLLYFKYDTSLVNGVKLYNLISKLHSY